MEVTQRRRLSAGVATRWWVETMKRMFQRESPSRRSDDRRCPVAWPVVVRISRRVVRLALMVVALTTHTFWISPVRADETAADPAALSPEVQALIRALPGQSLGALPGALRAIEAQAGSESLALFESMLAGDLRFHKTTRQLVRVSAAADGSGTAGATDVLTGETLQMEPASAWKRLRINNRVRMQLQDTLARLNLRHPDVEHRNEAAKRMLGEYSAASVSLLESVRASETDAGVRETLDAALALAALQTEGDEAKRLAALSRLEGRLEPAIRNTLEKLSADAALKAAHPQLVAEMRRVIAGIDRETRFYAFIEQLFHGLSMGSVLLLAATGLAVTFGVMGVINMAHGEMLMLGAYTMYIVQQLLPGWIQHSIWIAIPAAFLVSAGIGILIQRFVIRHLNGRPLETLLATFGISLILQQLVRTVFSPLNRRVVAPDWMSGSLEINPVLSLTWNRLYVLVFALTVFVCLLAVLRKTWLGLQVRAVTQNRAMAEAMGIRTDRIDALTFGLGSGIAGIAGVALSQLTNVGPNLGQGYIIDSFMVVVFGGVGNLLGTLIGSMSLGVANKFLEPMTGAVLANILILVFLILFIQKRPRGLFPQKGRAAE